MGRFAPGTSGNPGGRPKGLSAFLRAKYGEDGGKLVQELEKIAFTKNKATPVRVRLEALRELLNRHSGKAPDMVQLEDADGNLHGPITFVIKARAVA